MSHDEKTDGEGLKTSPTLDRRKQQMELQRKIEEKMKRIKHKIAIISGKGGVGKTTIAANLAIKFAETGSSTGALDVDITGPNMHKLLGIRNRPQVDPVTKEIIPVNGPLNIKVMSTAFLLESDYTPVIWRGPMKMGAVREYLGTVNWGDLEYLVIDLPPGTGDETLDIMQLVKPLDGVVVVSTSQEMSLIDVAKTINMSRKMQVPVLGIVENMSTFVCPSCGKETQVFGRKNGVEELASELEVPFLGSIPMEPDFVQQASESIPVIIQKAESKAKTAFNEMFKSLIGEMLE
ncbi:P-loop NTPase [Candidatus Bathyarchaeota archaeon]|nr:P-loop NTPase [Candidatus Bathyarchaeota archaeon]